MPEIIGGVLIAVLVILYLLFLLLKFLCEVLADRVAALWNHLTGETARRDERYRRDDEAREQFKQEILAGRHHSEEVLALVASFSHQPLPDDLRSHLGWNADTYWEAMQRIREEIRVIEERASTTRDHKELTESLAQLIESCNVPWDELMRVREAIHGTNNSVPFATVVHGNVLQILSVMAKANGSVPLKLGGLFQAVAAQLEPQFYLDLDECREKITTCRHQPLRLPEAVEALSTYDQMNGTDLAHKAAVSYWSFVEAAQCCAASRPTSVIKASYLDLFKPFLSGNCSNGSSDEFSRDGDKGSSTANSNGGCPECVEYYSVLRLKPGASERDIKTAYRDLAQIYHPDRFDGHHERVRRTAEEYLKSVNVAYSQRRFFRTCGTTSGFS
jgi:DnaJ-domain-containing protein 1